MILPLLDEMLIARLLPERVPSLAGFSRQSGACLTARPALPGVGSTAVNSPAGFSDGQPGPLIPQPMWLEHELERMLASADRLNAEQANG